MGFERELQQLSRLERHLHSDLGVAELEPSDHPVIGAAHAVLGVPQKVALTELLYADSVRSEADIPWSALEPKGGGADFHVVLRYVISELVRNIDEHAAARQGGSVRVRIHESGSQMCVGVADCGIGVRRSLARFHPARDDRAGITLAVTPGITGSTPRLGGNDVNAGAGLFFIRSLAALTGGTFLIVSGTAAWHLPQAPVPEDLTQSGHLVEIATGKWAGTAIAVNLPIPLPFSRKALFDEINKAYSRAVKDARHGSRERRSLLGGEEQ